MRRHFQSDEEIPLPAWQLFPEYKQKLDRIIELEDKLRSALSSRKRICFAMNAEPELKTKIMRTHVRHQFFPSTPHDRSHFIITIEGHLLDKSACKSTPFGNFLDKIRVQLDKSSHPLNNVFEWSHPVNNVFEWSSESFPEGVKGHCFRVKAYGDKPFPIKVFLYRSNDIRSRYELSPQLRELLPSMQVDPTEEQVLLAFYGHLSANNMFEGREKKQIKCSPELRALFGPDPLSLAALRQKISEHLSVCKPILVEYNVTTTSTVLATSFGPNAVAKAGGKAFDIEVDVKDPCAFDLLEGVNDITRGQREMIEVFSQMEQKASFLSSAIIDSCNTLFGGLKGLQTNPLAFDSCSSSSSSPSSSSSSSSKGLQSDPLVLDTSASISATSSSSFLPSTSLPSLPSSSSSPRSSSSSSSRSYVDPLIGTATGDTTVFPLRCSLPSEMLLRATDPFSLICRRAPVNPVTKKRTVRPQRGEGSILSGPIKVTPAASITPVSASPIMLDTAETAAMIGAAKVAEETAGNMEIAEAAGVTEGREVTDVTGVIGTVKEEVVGIAATSSSSSSSTFKGQGEAMDITTVGEEEGSSERTTATTADAAKMDTNKSEGGESIDGTVSAGDDRTKAQVVSVKEGGEKMDVEGAEGGKWGEEGQGGDVSVEGVTPTTSAEEAVMMKGEDASIVVVKEEGMKEGVKVGVEEGSEGVREGVKDEGLKEEGIIDMVVVKEEGTQEAIEVKIKEEMKGEMKEEGAIDLVAVKSEGKDMNQLKEGIKDGKEGKDGVKEGVKEAIKEGVKEGKEGKKTKKESKSDPAASSVPVNLPRAPDALSAIHGLRGFLDVGNDSLFAASEPWVLSTATLLAKRKLARN